MLRALEARYLLDAAIGETIAEASDTHQETDHYVFISEELENENIDASLFDESVSIHIISSDESGLNQINLILSNARNIDSIHILSHGQNNAIHIGSDIITDQNFDSYSHSFQTIKEALSLSGDLLFYGCDIAKNADGQNLIQSIAQSLDADIAASTNLTGDTALNGDWELEYRVGEIEDHSDLAENFVNIFSKTLLAPPANNDFANAEVLVVPTVTGNYALVTSSNMGATGEGSEPDVFGEAPLNTVWYKFTVSAPINLSIDTFGSDFDTTIVLYRTDLVAPGLGDITGVDGNDDALGVMDGTSEIQDISISLGFTYYIQIDGAGADTGNFVINIAVSPRDQLAILPDRGDITISVDDLFGTSSKSGSEVTENLLAPQFFQRQSANSFLSPSSFSKEGNRVYTTSSQFFILTEGEEKEVEEKEPENTDEKSKNEEKNDNQKDKKINENTDDPVQGNDEVSFLNSRENIQQSLTEPLIGAPSLQSIMSQVSGLGKKQS